jgi:hypothetical protein
VGTIIVLLTNEKDPQGLSDAESFRSALGCGGAGDLAEEEEETVQQSNSGLRFRATLLGGAWDELGGPRYPHVDELPHEASVGVTPRRSEPGGFEYTSGRRRGTQLLSLRAVIHHQARTR